VPNAYKTSLEFDAARLRADLGRVGPDEWTRHFNAGYHDGGWGGVALRAVGGEAGRLFPDPSGRRPYEDTEVLGRCPYFREVLAALSCPQRAVRLLSLRAGSKIKEHCDDGLNFDDGEIRLHIPIATNPDVEFVLAGERVVMNEGECWYLDFNRPHRVENRGATDRVHLVVDCVVNDWLRALFPPEAGTRTSGEGLQLFRAHVLQEPSLQEALREETDPDVFAALMTRLGRERGYQFTAGDVADALRAGHRAWLARWI
jgi:hypothetical protein